MISAFLRIMGLLTAAGGLWNLVSVVASMPASARGSEFAELAEMGSALGVLISWMVIISGLTLFGVGEALARFAKTDPKRIYADASS